MGVPPPYPKPTAGLEGFSDHGGEGGSVCQRRPCRRTEFQQTSPDTLLPCQSQLGDASPGSGRGGSKLSRALQTSLSPATPSSASSGPKVFPGQIGHVVPPASSGSTPGSPPSWTCLENPQRKAPRRHPNQMPEPPHLAPFDAKEQRLYSALPPDGRCVVFCLFSPRPILLEPPGQCSWFHSSPCLHRVPNRLEPEDSPPVHLPAPLLMGRAPQSTGGGTVVRADRPLVVGVLEHSFAAGGSEQERQLQPRENTQRRHSAAGESGTAASATRNLRTAITLASAAGSTGMTRTDSSFTAGESEWQHQPKEDTDAALSYMGIRNGGFGRVGFGNSHAGPQGRRTKPQVSGQTDTGFQGRQPQLLENSGVALGCGGNPGRGGVASAGSKNGQSVLSWREQELRTRALM
ncbi:uncharacterized protein LOC130131390 [Lampris incognitus]|uniref:uncharacterized protein LOC130131390 n=1 Tax=Lampris incognitus TaxID=2546036 RepID=UPI0024B58BA5|nr:uncharacterized protein LOC130131390 [Lampris incognitus]